MEDIVREYLKNNRQEMKKLKNENTKEKKHSHTTKSRRS